VVDIGNPHCITVTDHLRCQAHEILALDPMAIMAGSAGGRQCTARESEPPTDEATHHARQGL
jgi:hypothetical protein